MEIKSGLLYSKDHEWVRVEGERFVGITDYTQHALEIVYVELPQWETNSMPGMFSALSNL